MQTAGIVLCGGQSSRMGRPKAWLPIGNEFLLQRVTRLLAGVLEPIVVVAAPGQDLPPLAPEVRIVRDEHEGRGPLQGLAAGLSALQGQADAVYLSACDVPFLRPEFVRRMVELLGDAAAAVPKVAGRLHPLSAVYRLRINELVQEHLAANRLRMTDLFDKVATRFVEPHELADVDPDLHSLRNLNTPEEYEAAVREMDLHVGRLS